MRISWPSTSLTDSSHFSWRALLEFCYHSKIDVQDPKAFLYQVDEAVGSTDHEREAAERRLEQIKLALDVWTRVRDDLRAGHYADALVAITETGDPPVVLEASHAHRGVAEQLRAVLEAKAREATARFGKDFPSLARSHALEIDRTSRHPKYTLMQGFVRVDVDERRRVVTIRPRDGAATRIGADAALVAERVAAEIRRITDRPLDADGLARSLHTAYVAVLRAEGRPEGEEVPLRRVTARLAKNLNRFAGDEFNYDLARLVHLGKTVVDGKRLHLNHTRNTRQGLLLHGMEEGGYVGFLSFKREDE